MLKIDLFGAVDIDMQAGIQEPGLKRGRGQGGLRHFVVACQNFGGIRIPVSSCSTAAQPFLPSCFPCFTFFVHDSIDLASWRRETFHAGVASFLLL